MVRFRDNGGRQVKGSNPDLLPKEWFTLLMSRGEICKGLYERLASHRLQSRHAFQQTAANARYYQEMFVREKERLLRSEGWPQVDWMVHGRMLDELQEYKQQLPEWEYYNNCAHLFHELENIWCYPTTNLFIVLPLDLDFWDDSDSSTHLFRIYFLCGTSWQEDGLDDVPQHVHISNHPGYSLNRSNEFLQVYGDQALRVLQMVKYGYSEGVIKVPSLDTFEILYGCDTDITGSQLSESNIGPLVDLAINYLQTLSPSRQLNVKMDRSQSVAIKPYLAVPDVDRAEGKLYRWIDTYGYLSWVCQTHVLQHLDHEYLEKLMAFLHSHGGHIDMQQATLRVELVSRTDASQFCLTPQRHQSHVRHIDQAELGSEAFMSGESLSRTHRNIHAGT